MHYFSLRKSSINFHLKIGENSELKIFCAVILITMFVTPANSRVAYIPAKTPTKQPTYIPNRQSGMFQTPAYHMPEYLAGYNRDTSQYGSEPFALSSHHMRPFSSTKLDLDSEPSISIEEELPVSDDPNSYSPPWGSSEALEIQKYDSAIPFFDNSNIKNVELPRQPTFNFFTYYQEDKRKYAFVYECLDLDSK